MGTRRSVEERVLVLAPGQRDAEQVERVLRQARLPYHVCPDVSDLAAAVHVGAGVAILTEEALCQEAACSLEAALDDQPPWSNLPLVLLVDGTRPIDPLHLLGGGRKVLVLEQPVQQTTLLTALDAMLRTRERQYELRDLLIEHQRLNNTLEERVAERTAALRRTNALLEREVAERQRLERENLEISTHERQWFAQELHDGLCQQLSTLSFMTASLGVRLEAFDDVPTEVMEQVRRIEELADRSVREGRALARGLFPMALEEEGLMSALNSLAAHTADAYHIDCRIDGDEALSLDNHVTATNLYRIAQEALSNAIRHGRARQVVISLTAADSLVLSIADDGVGMNEKPVAAGDGPGIGLRTMRRRAKAIGATLEIRSRENTGTVVECRLPLDGEGAPTTSLSTTTST